MELVVASVIVEVKMRARKLKLLSPQKRSGLADAVARARAPRNFQLACIFIVSTGTLPITQRPHPTLVAVSSNPSTMFQLSEESKVRCLNTPAIHVLTMFRSALLASSTSPALRSTTATSLSFSISDTLAASRSRLSSGESSAGPLVFVISVAVKADGNLDSSLLLRNRHEPEHIVSGSEG